MNKTLILICLCVAGVASCADVFGAELFKLLDGRMIEGRKVGESEGVVVIEVTQGTIRSRIQVPAGDIASVMPDSDTKPGGIRKRKDSDAGDVESKDARQEKETEAEAKAEPQEDRGGKKDEYAEAGADREWERARKLLAAWTARQRRSIGPGSVLPYGMDPCEALNYDIYRRGILSEEFKGLQYWYGVLPGVTRGIWRDVVLPEADPNYSRYVFDPYAVMYPVLDAEGKPTGAWALREDVAGPVQIIAVRAEDMALYQTYLQLLKDRASAGMPLPGGGPVPAAPPATRWNNSWDPPTHEQKRITLLKMQGICVPPPHPSMIPRR